MDEVIILSAGKIKYLHLPISSNTSNAMVPINGKPAIGWIIDDLIKKKVTKVRLVIQNDDKKLINYLLTVYANKIDIKFTSVKQTSSILESLKLGLEECDESKGVKILLGDTLITDEMNGMEDFIYISSVPTPHKWCIAITDSNGIIGSFKDKNYFFSDEYFAVCGFYSFTNTVHLKSCLELCIENGLNQMSNLLTFYKERYPIKAKITSLWYDFGNVENLIRSKQLLLQTRYFNSLKVDPVLNTITKTSGLDDKLRNELLWYEKLPENLQVLCPRIISKKILNGKLQLMQEYYGYPTLAELFLFSDLGVDEWESIIFRLLELHSEFQKFKSDLPKESFKNIYLDKTWERINTICSGSNYWESLILGNKEIIINNIGLLTVGQIKLWIQEKITNLIETSTTTIIHGDFCFSNILFDLNSHIGRLIDPRGSFGSVGIYGDPRYDMAKFLHSLDGGYDFIVTDQFYLKELDQNNFQFELMQNPHSNVLTELFVNKLFDYDFNPQDIYFIEGLLFLSMLPLHKDKPLRQLAMYFTALKIFNKLYENSN